jgi:hypothetical protein
VSTPTAELREPDRPAHETGTREPVSTPTAELREPDRPAHETGSRHPVSMPTAESAAAAAPAPYVPPAHPPAAARRSRRPFAVAGIAAVAIVGAGAYALAGGRGDDPGNAGAGTTTVTGTQPAAAVTTSPGSATTSDPATDATTAVPATSATTTATAAPTTEPAPLDPCAGITDEPCITIDALRITPEQAVEVTWTPHNFVPDVAAGFHAHLYWNTATAAQASSDSPDAVPWDAVDQVIHTSLEVLTLGNKPPGATGVCATVGIAPAHTAYDPTLFHCVELPPGI